MASLISRLQQAHIVAIGILYECQGVVRDLSHKLDLLGFRGVIDASLQDTTSMAVGSDLNTVLSDGVVDELYEQASVNHFARAIVYIHT